MDSKITIETPMGEVAVDLKEVIEALDNARCKSKLPPTIQQQHHQEFFEGEQTKCTSQYFSRVHAGPWLMSLDGLIEERFETERTDRYNRNGRGGVQLMYHEFEVGYKEKRSLLLTGDRYIVDKVTGRKFRISQSVDDDGDPRITVHGNPDDGAPREFLDMLNDWFHESGPLKGAVFTIDWKFLERESGASDTLVLEKGLKQQIERHIFKWIEMMPSYRERGLPISRGILLAGPPGTGKTLFCRSLLERAVDMTCIVVTGDRIGCRGVITDAFLLARNLAPSIIVLEDLDTLGGLDRRSSNHPLLSELLNALDGVESNDGVLCLGTTNHISAIDDALRDRPGRFDKVLIVDIPSQDMRIDLLTKFSEKFKLSKDIKMGDISSRTPGLTGAWLFEMFKGAELFAEQRGSHTIGPKDISDSIDEIREGRNDARKETYLGITTEESNGGLYA